MYKKKKIKSNVKIKSYPFRQTRFLSKKILNEKFIRGHLAIKASEKGILTRRQFEATRRIISRAIKRRSKIKRVRRIFVPLAARPRGARHGGGRGKNKRRIYYIKQGMLLYKIRIHNTIIGEKILKKAKKKLPVLSKVIKYNRY